MGLKEGLFTTQIDSQHNHLPVSAVVPKPQGPYRKDAGGVGVVHDNTAISRRYWMRTVVLCRQCRKRLDNVQPRVVEKNENRSF